MSKLPNVPPPPHGHFPWAETLNPERLLSREEVQSIFAIPKRFLELAACKGGGPAFVKVGRLSRYQVQDVVDWIAANRFLSTSDADQRKGIL